MSLRFGNVRISGVGVVISNSTRLTSNALSTSTVQISNTLTGNIITANRTTSNLMVANTISLSAANAFTGNYNTLSGTPVLPSITDYASNTSTASNLAVINRPLQYVNNQGSMLLNTKVFTATALTVANGTVTFYPTTTGAAGGTPLFSQIITMQCSPWVNTSTAINMPNVSGKSLSADNAMVVFNVTVGQGVLLGGSSQAMAGANVPCMCLIMGV